MFEDLLSVKKPKISILTPSLNHGRFLVETIESILSQSYRNFEHIVIDGGSTDNTIEILNKYPHIKWISEKDDNIVQAYRKGFDMAKGEYIMQCCVSDGYLNKDWFRHCVEILDSDEEVSLVWGLPQYMTEDGHLRNISYVEFFNDPPPQKMDFFPFWLATGFWYPEGNYCVPREIFDLCFPKDDTNDPFINLAHMGFIYNFNTLGYLPYFLPVIANCGRTHEDSRGNRLSNTEMPIMDRYYRYVKDYKNKFLKGSSIHVFKNRVSTILKEVTHAEIRECRWKILRYRIINSRCVRTNIYTMQKKLRKKIKEGQLLSYIKKFYSTFS